MLCLLVILAPVYGQGPAIAAIRQQLATPKHDTVRMRLYSELADQYRKAANPDSIYWLATTGIVLAHNYNRMADESRFYWQLGHYYKRKHQYPKAQRSLETALSLVQKSGPAPTPLHSIILYRLATVYGDQGKVKEVINTTLASLHIAEELKDSLQMCGCYDLLVLAHRDIKDLPVAFAYAQKSVALAQQLVRRHPDQQVALFYAESNLADLYETTGQYARAYPYLKKGLDYVVSVNDLSQISQASTMIGYNLVRQKRPADAVRHLRESLSRQQISVSSEFYEIYALAYQQLGQHDKALRYAQKAYEMALKQGQSMLLQSTLTTLIGVEKSNKKYPDALAHYHQLISITDTLFTQAKNKAIAEVEARYQVAQKEQTIALLQKDAALRQTSLAKQQNELTVQHQRQLLLALVALLLLVVVIGLYITYRREQITNLLLEDQNDQIQSKADQLQQLNALKDKLFGVIGHDLRSPISAMQLNLNKLVDEERRSGQLKPRHSRLIQLADGVYNTVDNLLNWSLLQRNNLLPQRTQVELQEIAESIQNLYSYEIESKQLTLITSYDPTPVEADENQLQIVLRNIIHNAIKFTPPGGQIKITVRQQDNRAIVSIQDSGIGMKLKTNQPTFSISRGTVGEKGTGLGLDICREISRLNNWTMEIDSEPGQGTTVSLWV